MAFNKINIGTIPNDGTGDPNRIAGEKINSNFDITKRNYLSTRNINTSGWYNLGKIASKNGIGLFNIIVTLKNAAGTINETKIEVDITTLGITVLNSTRTDDIVVSVGLKDYDTDGMPYLLVYLDKITTNYVLTFDVDSKGEQVAFNVVDTATPVTDTMDTVALVPLGYYNNVASSHIADTNNPHSVTAEQINAQEISNTTHTITGAGWLEIAHLTNTGHGWGSFEINLGTNGGVSVSKSRIYITNAYNNPLDSVIVNNISSYLEGIGVVVQGDNTAKLYAKVTHSGTDYPFDCRIKALTASSEYTATNSSAVESLTMDVEFLFGIGNTFNNALNVINNALFKSAQYDSQIMLSSGSSVSPFITASKISDGSSLDLRLLPIGGNLGVGIGSNPTERLEVNGNIKADNVTFELNADLKEIVAAGYNLDVNGNAGLLQVIGALWNEIKNLKQD